MDDIFHDGERYVQERTGERDRAVLNGRTIGRTIPPAAQAFLHQQPHCVIGWQAPDGAVWASILAAAPGFASATADGRGLLLVHDDDGASAASQRPTIRDGAQAGLLFLEFSTRRRLRVNGRVTTVSPLGMHIDVHEAFANCPKYIQRRTLNQAQRPGSTAPARSGTELTDDLRAWIAHADTFFIASSRHDGRADVSHRGGSPGFVVVDDDVLRIPDYAGNSMFQTFGNLHVNPAAGLAFLDFEHRRQLRLSGTASLDFLRNPPRGDGGGGPRWWSFRWHEWTETPLPPTFDWVLVEPSPFNP